MSVRVKKEEEEPQVKPVYDEKRPPWKVAVIPKAESMPGKIKKEEPREDTKDGIIIVKTEGSSALRPPWEVTVVGDADNDKKPVLVQEAWKGSRVEEDQVNKMVSAVRRARHKDNPPPDVKESVAGRAAAWESAKKSGVMMELVPPLAAWEMDDRRELARSEPAGTTRLGVDRLVCLKNYAAVGAELSLKGEPLEEGNSHARGKPRSCYGLIDRGTRQTGVRSLIMHAKVASTNMDWVRAGTLLRVRSTLPGGGRSLLRVLYTTPSRYYSPGEMVTTLSVGVDAVDWQSLMPKGGRI